MSDICRNEEWLAAYLDKSLPEKDRRLYETHLSACQECLAELIAAKAELDGITAEETGATLLMPLRDAKHGITPLHGILRPAPLAATLSAAAVVIAAAGLIFSGYLSSGDREFKEAQPLVGKILAARNIGEMRLSDGPERPATNPAVYRGAGTPGAASAAQLERSLTRTLERHGSSARLNALLGDLYVADNQIERADNYYARALELDPGDAALLNDRAVVAYRLGRMGESRELLEDARTAGGQRLEVLYNLAVLAGETGDRDSKLHYIDLYLKRDFSSPWAERMRALARD
ncbi:MAG: zf-HC2 domain-containing protein [Candidatus Krumholzibacteriaceae bacterium]|jgi:tetratricopeptide (TPR) repeat protein